MSKPVKGGLGRGLSALIRSGPGSGGVAEVDIDQIVPNPYQPRTFTDATLLNDLADSIRLHGVLQPLLVTQAGLDDQGRPRYQLIAGERRWQAARLAGMQRLPVMVKEATPVETLALALVENLQRADLDPLEEAMAYRQLMEEFRLTQEEVATQVGKSRSAIANSLRLANLSSQVKEALAAGQVSEGHARALLTLLDTERQAEALAQVMAGQLSVRATEELVRRLLRSGVADTQDEAQNVKDRAVEAALRTALSTKVSLQRAGAGGRLVIHFYTDEQLSALYDLLAGGQERAGEEYFQAG